MNNTIAHTEIINIWDGRVIIDEIRQFKDDRGLLTELWRTDDNKINTSFSSAVIPQMSYWSVTNPFVMRGPHEHKDQCDFFVSWFNRMIYHLYNPKLGKSFSFITDPTKVYRVKVDIGIIHGYRNLELRPITTGNFPTALFMGENKKQPIDEIRHEEKISDSLKTYVVLGAGGRLGKSLVNKLLEDMDFHKYHVIPIYEKLEHEQDVVKFIDELTKTTPVICDAENVAIINCAALTNVQKLVNYTDEVRWNNVELPVSLAKNCRRVGCKFFQISSDYVYRENDNSVYTRSKKDMEDALKDYDVHLIRVANLFSTDVTDTHNMISKLREKAKAGESIAADPSQKVFPTDVDELVKSIITYVNDDDRPKDINFFGEEMTVEDVFIMSGGKNVTHIKSAIKFNSDKFLEDGYAVKCRDKIFQKLKQ